MTKKIVPIVSWKSGGHFPKVMNFLNRESVEEKAMVAATSILKKVKMNGDNAVIDAAREFDQSNITIDTIKISEDEIVDAKKQVDQSFKNAANETYKRVKIFSELSLKDDWEKKTDGGGFIGERFIPFDRVGAYIPGGSAPLASTALMTLTLAKVAGVKELVACSPASKSGTLNPYIIYSLNLAGATEIYKIGGVHAIGAMAYGTESIKKVRKIVGPGGPYVTAAKKQVYGDVALDMVAGPSEIAILCDSSANSKHMAADLLSQAEHGTGSEKALLVTTSVKLAQNIRLEILTQAKKLKRYKIIREVMEKGLLIVTVKNLNEGINLCNLFAPEHMELVVRQPKKIIPKIKTAGALFIGPYTPEAVGDFVAGPSHVLPTGGTCHYFSGLSVDDFRRRTSIVEYTKSDLYNALSTIKTFGRVETLDGHARSASIRFED